MYPAVQASLEKALALIPQIPAERKLLLEQFSQYIVDRVQAGLPVLTNTICTHNSRRSHLGQVWVAAMAEHFQIEPVQAFSGGTEATACHPNTIAALRAQGFEIEQGPGDNPVYTVRFSAEGSVSCWSKRYNDAANPQEGFAAILVCGSADGACPIVSGATLRLACTYIDPKVSDGTAEQDATYQERSLQIASEMGYAICVAAQRLGRPCPVEGCC
jgi:arsenate reductase